MSMPRALPWALALLAALSAVAAQLTVLPGLLPPEETNPKLSSEDIEVTIGFNWTQEAFVQAYSPEAAGATLYCRARRGDEFTDPVTIPAIKDGELVTEGRCGEVSLSSGYRTVTVEVALTPDFFEAVSTTDVRYRVIPGIITLLPPLLTVVLALTTKQVHISLFAGVYLSAFFIHWFDPFRAFLRSIDTYVLEAFADKGHVTVILFDWFLVGITTLMTRAGGSDGIARAVIGFAKTRRITQFVCFVSGLLLFFDTMSNTLIIGSTFRTMFDDLLISREKLSYVVDSTGAPIASLSPVSSWVGYELSLIEKSFESIEKEFDVNLVEDHGWEPSSFIIFMKTLPGRYYPIGMLFLMGFLILTQRDFFTMLTAERRVLNTGKIYADDADPNQTNVDEKQQLKEGVPARLFNAVVPIATLIFLVILGLGLTGRDKAEAKGLSLSMQNVFGNASSYSALLYSTLFVSVFTILFYRAQYYVPGEDRIYWFFNKAPESKPLMSLMEGIDTWIEGIKNLTSTIMVLILAWSTGDALTSVGTDTYVASAVSDNIDYRAIPVMVFSIAAAISCATGTSWGTMAIMFPIATRATYAARPGNETVMLNTIASILAGSVFGDHISPISDTTILSALSSRCDLMHHVKTQAPYATVVALIGAIFGDLFVGYIYPDWAGLLITIIMVMIIAYFISAPVNSNKPDAFGRLLILIGVRSPNDDAASGSEDEYQSLNSGGGRRKATKGSVSLSNEGSIVPGRNFSQVLASPQDVAAEALGGELPPSARAPGFREQTDQLEQQRLQLQRQREFDRL